MDWIVFAKIGKSYFIRAFSEVCFTITEAH